MWTLGRPDSERILSGFEAAIGQASGLQRNHLQFGFPWPGACQTDYALLCVTMAFCDLIGGARILALVQKLYTNVTRPFPPRSILNGGCVWVRDYSMPWFTHGKGYGSESTPPSICCSTNRATVIFHSFLLPRMSTAAKNCLGQTKGLVILASSFHKL